MGVFWGGIIGVDDLSVDGVSTVWIVYGDKFVMHRDMYQYILWNLRRKRLEPSFLAEPVMLRIPSVYVFMSKANNLALVCVSGVAWGPRYSAPGLASHFLVARRNL